MDGTNEQAGKYESFSRRVKDEIFRAASDDMCCVMAEFSGLILFGTQNIHKDGIEFTTENQSVLGSFVSLARSLGLEAEVRQHSENTLRYTARLSDNVKVAQLLYDIDMMDAESGDILRHISRRVTERTCCKRAFARGAFLGSGTISDPKKNYNLEIVTPSGELCRELSEMLRSIEFEFKTAVRKNKHVLYIKNSESISDFLSFLGAYNSQMQLLNIKIEKEIRNGFNRVANGETSNLVKTINAAVDQICAIQEVDRLIGLDNLPEDLREIARLRLENKEVSLSELGKLLDPPLTKSGVNHRMKKIIGYLEN